MEIFLQVINFILISLVIQLMIATVLIIFGTGKLPDTPESGLVFDELYLDYSTLSELKTFPARDGEALGYRHYPAESNKVLILVHGSGWHSQYFLPLAEYISVEGLAQVYTPDLRGHGPAPKKRGDVDYINQLEDDLADFIAFIRKDNPDATLIVGGHSSGGGLVIRFAGSQYGQQADAYVLLSPYLKYNAPTMRPNSGGWAYAYTGRIAGLSILNTMGIHWFDHLTAIEFNMPEDARDGSETLAYSHRLNTGYAPRNYKKDLKAIMQPFLLLAGTADEAFVADQFESLVSEYTSVQVELMPDLSHMGVVVSPDVQPLLEDWLGGL
ncbi:MAG: alpha/beta fold hydrolase [Anaerolineae bacterium]|jgi:alpha-beta hydrolase superfamily lysophospholipase|nr:alpha/beta fold hydrolase [Anaerolineae bacterium]MBT4311392.1 alpha/beta fold hydrolase [Anaerolineae bacterium]MBT4460211.1 alpha/beta fold hydrolase [Anaerolineae bacterium]MBT6062820.1 alpha/beta fold hydrolase [Anaerolineae bacterium]MBT6323473.1 alpha/beta fold hydrolase [Anaerolineae bacterium]